MFCVELSCVDFIVCLPVLCCVVVQLFSGSDFAVLQANVNSESKPNDAAALYFGFSVALLGVLGAWCCCLVFDDVSFVFVEICVSFCVC